MYVRVFLGEYTRTENNELVHHESVDTLVNPDCPTRIIYDFIQQSFDIDPLIEFDLCDENGNLVFILNKEPWTNGMSYLKPEANYFVIFMEKDENNSPNPIFYMHECFPKTISQHVEFLSKIKRQLNPSLTNKAMKSSKTRMSTTNLVLQRYNSQEKDTNLIYIRQQSNNLTSDSGTSESSFENCSLDNSISHQEG